jgi:glycosyltransferase involved in cell wall biosynthesis
MKILVLTSNLKRIGGIEQYNKNLLRALNELKENACPIELKKSNLFFKLFFIVQFIMKALTFRPDIIFCGHINFSPAVYFFKKIFGYNYIVFTHGIDVWNIKNNLKIKALKNANLAVSVSQYTAEKLKKQIPSLNNKIYFLPNTVDGEKFYSKEKTRNLFLKYNLSADNKIILTVARLSANEKYKGYDKVIEALPLVLKEIPDTKYILVGTGDDLDRIKKLIEDLNLKEYVILAGRVEEITDYYNFCDIFVMPSKGEGFGIVFLEALACGKPVIAGNQDGSRDAILDGELGILVDPDNIEEIAQAVVNVFKKKTSPKLLDGKYLREKVLKVYGFDKFKEKVKNLIHVLSR